MGRECGFSSFLSALYTKIRRERKRERERETKNSMNNQKENTVGPNEREKGK